MEPESVTPPPNAVCANCGTPLLGEYCYACGQPVKGLVRHLSGVLGDVAGTMLNIDSRVLRTLPALFLRPGFLTREYFAGKRVRYVTPFRLMFFLALAAFFALQLAIDKGMSAMHFSSCIGSHARSCDATDKLAASSVPGGVGYDGFQQAATPSEVLAKEKQALAGIDRAAANPNLPATARGSVEMARTQVRDMATLRLAELDAAARATPPATTAGGVSVPAPAHSAGAESLSKTDDLADAEPPGGDNWDLPRDRLHLNWLPAFVNDWLDQAGQHMHVNIVAIKHGNPATRRAAIQHLVATALSLLPQTMFVLMPLFALLLKVFYIFRRRLYMEHLIVALHNHAFIFLSLLLLAAVHALRLWLPHTLLLDAPLGLISAAIWIWIFVYLFLMQKRVYGQGWFSPHSNIAASASAIRCCSASHSPLLSRSVWPAHDSLCRGS